MKLSRFAVIIPFCIVVPVKASSLQTINIQIHIDDVESRNPDFIRITAQRTEDRGDEFKKNRYYGSLFIDLKGSPIPKFVRMRLRNLSICPSEILVKAEADTMKFHFANHSPMLSGSSIIRYCKETVLILKPSRNSF